MKHLLLILALFASSVTLAQVTLGTSPYNQDFNSIGSGILPAGFTVRASATTSVLGTTQAFAGAGVAWNNTTGAFKNFASSNSLLSNAAAAAQTASTDRALGLRQTGTLGDPGGAFVLQLANTIGLKDFRMSFKLQSLDITSPRATVWRVDYGFGASPTSFTGATAVGTLTTGGTTFTNNIITVDFGSALNNQGADVWIRIVTLAASTGSGNRASSAIDDLSLTYNVGFAASFVANPTVIAFGNQGVGTNSTAQPVTLSYSNLDGSDVTVSATAPFAVSKTAGGPFSTGLTYTSAELTGSSTIIYSQFNPVAIGPASGNITITGGGVSGSATVSLSGTGVNLNPVAADDSFAGFYGDIIAGNVSTNDTDPQSLPLTFTKLTDPTDGTLTFNTDGTFSYQSVSGSAATQTFTYRATDTQSFTADATVTISLTEKPKIFISQYYEGTSVNKWIELTNPTGSPVNTASPPLKLALYSITGDAGNIVISGPPSQIMSLNFIIPPQSSVLISNTGNGTEVPYLTLASAVQSSNSVINFNGNDGVALLDGANNIVDAFGTGVNAKDVSYVRNQDALTPSPAFIVADWTRTALSIVQNAADLDDPNRLGAHVQPILPPCVSPAAQPTDLSFSSVGTKTVTLNFTTTVADEFLIVRSLSNNLTAGPVDGVDYNAGNSLGGGVVAGRVVNGSFVDSNLIPGTTYYYFIFALNSIECANAPSYLATSPLSGTTATEPLPPCVTPAFQPANFQITFSNYNVIQGTFTTVTAVDEFLVVMSTDSTMSTAPLNQITYNVGDSVGGGIVIKRGATGTFNRSALSQNTLYYFYIFSLNSNCSGGPLYLTSGPLTGKQKTGILDANTLNYYYGNLHSHSSYSDGNKDDTTKKPEDDYAFAKNSKKMDFLGISEHNHTQAGMRLANWAPGMVAAQNATTPNFIAMHGMEWGVISGGGHVVVYGIDSLIGWEPGEYQIYVPKSTYTGPTGLFNVINRHGLNAIATLAHPNTTDFNNLSANYDALADSAIVGSALESGPAFSTDITYSDPPSSLAYLNYYNRMLARGYHLGANLDHDNHNLTFGRHTKGRTVVLAPALTENDLLDAMKKMRFYASEDSAARISYTVNGQLLGSKFSGNGRPHISVTGATTSPVANITIWSGTPGSGVLPTAIASISGSTLSYIDSTIVHLGTAYYYADITEADGSRIITSPIWYTRNDSIKSEQTINFNPLTSKTYGDADFDPAATSTNATIPITYTSSDSTVAKIVAGKVHIRKAGTVTITANQAGSSLYIPAAAKSQTLNINPLFIRAAADTKLKVYGDADPDLTYTFTPSLVNGDTFTGSLIRVAGEDAGTYLINRGTLSLSNNYTLRFDSAALTISKKVVTAKADPKQKVFGSADPELTYTVVPPLIIGDSFNGALTRQPGENVGIYLITRGTLALSANYSLRVDSAAFTITPKSVVVTADAKQKVFGTADPVLTYTVAPPLTIMDTIRGSLVRAPGENVGAYVINQGTLALNGNYSLGFVSNVFTITPASQVIIFGVLPAKNFGDPDFGITATGGASGNPVTFSSSDPTVATVTGTNAHIVGAGTTIITASQAGNANYSAAVDVTRVLLVNKASATITLSNLTQTFDGNPKSATVTTLPSGLESAVGVTYNGSSTAPSAPGSYAVVATLNHPNYQATPATGTLTISSPLKVQYRNADAQVSDNEGKPYLKIVNNGNAAVPYNQLTARYWITPENFTGSLGLFIDWAQMGNNKVTMRYVILSNPQIKALGYIEYGFTASAGSLAAHGNSGEIQSRYANSDWTTFDESNDYSFMTSAASYADNALITLYQNGALVWGTEPASDVSVVRLKAYSQATGSTSSNTISTYLNLQNEGNVAVDYKDVTARYWFTTEGTSPLNFWIDWAKIGSPAITGSFFAISPPRTNANVYLEVKVRPAASTFYPLTATGNIQYRVTKNDWSNFNQLNDYSYKAGTMAENSRITIYYKGVLVYGTEPAGSSSARIAMDSDVEEEVSESSGPVVYPNPSTGKFTLQLNDASKGAFSVTIYNSVGQAVNVYTGEKGVLTRDYDLQLSKGMYLMQIKWEDHTQVKKLIID